VRNLRFTNDDVLNHLDQMLDAILAAVTTPRPTAGRQP
jgi:hypothetical protein